MNDNENIKRDQNQGNVKPMPRREEPQRQPQQPQRAPEPKPFVDRPDKQK